MSMRRNVPSSPARATSRATFSYATLLVEGESEVGELQGDVRLQLLGYEPLEDHLVLVRHGCGAAGVGNRLAEQRRVRVQSRVVQLAQDGDALVERLAGDEAGCADAPPVLLHESLEARALSGVEDGRSGECGQCCRDVGQARSSRTAQF